jgi:transposase
VEIRTLDIDLAKNLFRVHCRCQGKSSLSMPGERRSCSATFRRRQLLPFMAQTATCLVEMEACGGAHYWALEIAKVGTK